MIFPSTSIAGSTVLRVSPIVTSKLALSRTLTMKPIRNEASPRTCQGVGPLSVPVTWMAKSVVDPARTPNIAEISATKMNGLNWIRTSRPTVPKTLKMPLTP